MNVLALAAWRNDSPFRFLADAFQYSGARVVRAGWMLDSTPHENPPVFDLGIFTRDQLASLGAGTQVDVTGCGKPFRIREIVGRLREQGFSPEMLLLEPWPEMRMLDELPAGFPKYVYQGEEVGCDLNVHRWRNFGARNCDVYICDVFFSEAVIQHLSDVKLKIETRKGTLAEHVDLMNRAVMTLATPESTTWYEAAACGSHRSAPLVPDKDFVNCVLRQLEEFKHAHAFGKRELCDSCKDAFVHAALSTYRVHAERILERLCFASAPVPRLWT